MVSPRSTVEEASADAIFAAMIAEIHWPGAADPVGDFGERSEMDIGRAEMLAMIRSYLGMDYAPVKVEKVCQAQESFRQRQSHLHTLYDMGELTPEQYVASVNAAMGLMDAACADVLGVKDFERLFGCNPQEECGRLDLEQFLESESNRKAYPETGSFGMTA